MPLNFSNITEEEKNTLFNWINYTSSGIDDKKVYENLVSMSKKIYGNKVKKSIIGYRGIGINYKNLPKLLKNKSFKISKISGVKNSNKYVDSWTTKYNMALSFMEHTSYNNFYIVIKETIKNKYNILYLDKELWRWINNYSPKYLGYMEKEEEIITKHNSNLRYTLCNNIVSITIQDPPFKFIPLIKEKIIKKNIEKFNWLIDRKGSFTLKCDNFGNFSLYIQNYHFTNKPFS